MIKEVKIDSMEELMELTFEQKRNKDHQRLRSSYFYRGMPNSDFSLLTSLSRNCGEKYRVLEKQLLDNFTKYANIEDPSISESVWRAMIVGQHHGLPTRLLDWSHSTLIALHFANTESDFGELDKHDCVMWRIDANEIKSLLPNKYKNDLNEKSTFIFSLDRFVNIAKSIEDYDMDMGCNSFAIVEPPSIDQRIVNQYSYFTVIPSGITDLIDFLDSKTENTVKYIIDKKLRWDLRDILDQFNINERMIYPGLDGIAKWLSRHYYVK